MSTNKESDATKLAVIANDISYIKGEIKEIKEKLEGDYVTHQEFEPVKKIVYGLVGITMVAVLGAILALVIIK